MQAMQYHITLPTDYDMNIIKERVRNTGHLMDGFQDLLVKAFLITEKSAGALQNSYCPFYLWQDTVGMNRFIFDGYFDNILQSFGWHSIEIGISQTVELGPEFTKSRYVVAEEYAIPAQSSLKEFQFATESQAKELGKAVIYNPDKWRYATFHFFEERPAEVASNAVVYEILYLAMGKQ